MNRPTVRGLGRCGSTARLGLGAGSAAARLVGGSASAASVGAALGRPTRRLGARRRRRSRRRLGARRSAAPRARARRRSARRVGRVGASGVGSAPARRLGRRLERGVRSSVGRARSDGSALERHRRDRGRSSPRITATATPIMRSAYASPASRRLSGSSRTGAGPASSSSRRRAITLWSSSLLLPDTRTASPWICDLTFGNSSRISFVMLLGELVRQAAPQADPLADLVAAGRLDLAPVEDLERQAAPDRLRLDEVLDRGGAVLVVGERG